MSDTEPVYDLLDVLRVVKGAWRWLVICPLLAGSLAGIWAYHSAQTAALPYRSQATVRFPAAAFQDNVVDRWVAPPRNERPTAILAEEVATHYLPEYRTLKLDAVGTTLAASSAVLESEIQRLQQEVQIFDGQRRIEAEEIAAQRDLLSQYLSALSERVVTQGATGIEADANAVALVVSALSGLDLRTQEIRERGSGPLVIVSPVQIESQTSIQRWLRFPIVAILGGILSVLFVAFTRDAIRLAVARRRNIQ